MKTDEDFELDYECSMILKCIHCKHRKLGLTCLRCCNGNKFKLDRKVKGLFGEKDAQLVADTLNKNTIKNEEGLFYLDKCPHCRIHTKPSTTPGVGNFYAFECSLEPTHICIGGDDYRKCPSYENKEYNKSKMNENKAIKLWKVKILDYEKVEAFFIRNNFTESEFTNMLHDCIFFCNFDTLKKMEDILEYIEITPMKERFVKF